MMKVKQALKWAVARAAYPGVLFGSVLFAERLLAREVPPALASTLSFLAVLLVTLGLERVSPHVASWNAPRHEVRQDVAYLLLAAVLQPLGKLAGLALASAVSLAIVALIGPHELVGLPTSARALIAFAAADLGKYALHRLAHERAGWWRFHAEHHAPRRMYALNATRLHPVNLLWNLGLDAAAPALLGLDLRTATLLAVLRGSVSILQHANVRLVLGPLSWVFSTPELHQWHHSSELGEANSNYGSTLIVWDVLFGTRRWPRDRAVPTTLGIADGAVRPGALRGQIVWPFCQGRATCRGFAVRT